LITELNVCQTNYGTLTTFTANQKSFKLSVFVYLLVGFGDI